MAGRFRFGPARMPYPDVHYHVDCLMCGGSLALESDSLPEVFEVIKIHVKLYANEHEAERENKRRKFGPPPHTNKEIFESDWFAWEVKNMNPFDKIRKRVEKDIDALVHTTTTYK